VSGDATFPVAPRLARASVDPEKSEATSTVVAPAGGLMFDCAGFNARHRGRARPEYRRGVTCVVEDERMGLGCWRAQQKTPRKRLAKTVRLLDETSRPPLPQPGGRHGLLASLTPVFSQQLAFHRWMCLRTGCNLLLTSAVGRCSCHCLSRYEKSCTVSSRQERLGIFLRIVPSGLVASARRCPTPGRDLQVAERFPVDG